MNDRAVLANLEKMSDGERLAIVLTANSVRFGGDWGFLLASDSEFKSTLETLKTINSNVMVKMVDNGLLVHCRKEFIKQVVQNAVGVDALGGRDYIESVTLRKKDEITKMRRFGKRLMEGEESSATYKQGHAEVTFGIYCVNETNYIRADGVDVRSYKLRLNEAMNVLHETAKNYGREVYLKIKEPGKDGAVSFAPITDVMARIMVGDEKLLAAAYRGLQIASSETGLFITVRVS